MIIFDLACNGDHRFEGWFRSAEDFANQQARRLVRCPSCDSDEVRRVPSPVSIAGNRSLPAGGSPAADEKARLASVALLPAATQVMAMYRQFVQTLLANSDNVGDAFAAEARRIHRRESPERAICGNASEDECDALREEGIPVVRLPDIKGEDLN
jgi:hypothetical protein